MMIKHFFQKMLYFAHNASTRASTQAVMPSAKKGLFISFEGGEGTGKSTQIALLAGALRRQGHEVVVTREPGGTKGAEVIRHLLLSGAVEKYGAKVEALLFAAARVDHVDKVIAPALQSGKIVLCDRFIDSTRVYQGDGQEQGKDEADDYISALEKLAILDVRPEITFILDLPSSIGLARADKRREATENRDRFEKETIEIQERRRLAFLEIAKNDPYRCVIIDAMRPVDMIAADIATIASKRLKNANS